MNILITIHISDDFFMAVCHCKYKIVFFDIFFHKHFTLMFSYIDTFFSHDLYGFRRCTFTSGSINTSRTNFNFF